MHRDLKLGLALAVLLIGSTSAFFFRSETEADVGLPRLQNPERLDAEIAGRDHAPYLGEPECDPSESPGGESPWTKPAFLGGASVQFLPTAATPDPIRIVIGDETEEDELGPSVPMPQTVDPPAVAEGERTHVVKPGDTLSSLAERYLGSTTRFNEIFDLNRDRLVRPNDLRVGMTIRIPAAKAAKPENSTETAPESARPDAVVTKSAPKGPENSGQSTVDVGPPAETSEKPSETGKLFVPARKTPFVPGRYRMPGVPAANAGTVDGERK